MEREDLKKALNGHYKSRMYDLQKLWKAYCEGEEDRYSKDIGNIFEYGLCFDYVPKGTFSDQRKSYFRYQISYGGPSEEFRFFCDERLEPYKIEFWYLDWFKGTKKTLQGKNKELLTEIFDWFKEGGAVEKALKDN